MDNGRITDEPLLGGPLTGNLAAVLRKKIVAGHFRPGQFLPSVRKLSAERGLAHKTVYHALRALAAEGWVSAEAGRGYRVLSRANDPDRGAPVAFVLTPQSASGSGVWDNLRKNLLQGLQQAASDRGWMLLAVECATDGLGEAVGRLREMKVCGAIIDTFSPEVVAAVGRMGLPVVSVEHWHESLPIDSVVQDGFLGGYLAGAWLAERGHRRLGWVAPTGPSRQGSERFGGAAAALAERDAGIPSELRLGLPDPGAPERLRIVRDYLARADRPQAVLALWQGASSLVAQAARELGLVPGRDLDMVGWSTEGDYESEFRPNFAGGPVPPAVVWDVATLARTAVARLAERRADPKLPPIMLKIPTRLKLAD